MGYTRSQISRFEIESAEPPIDFWVKLAKLFGLNINWALTGNGLPYIDDFQESPERDRVVGWQKLVLAMRGGMEELLKENKNQK
jgi:hypothetical protein